MTNGEKIKELFPHFDVEDKTEYFGQIRNLDDHFIKADIDFWNAEYKEPDSVIDLIWEEIENIYLEMPDNYNHFQRTQFYLEVKRVFDRYRNGEKTNG